MRPLGRQIPWISPRDAAAVETALRRYWLGIIPGVRVELRRWQACAAAIPDPTLRRHAAGTLAAERLNAEAAAVFGILAPRSHRRNAVRLMVAFQVMYDYLDTVGEQRVEDPLHNGLQLHKALPAPLSLEAEDVDYYALHPQRDDGGYLTALIGVCRDSFAALPSAAVVRSVAVRAAVRCGEAQSYTHAVLEGKTDQLAGWSVAQDRASGYHWWELAAGGISSVGVYALFASAANPQTTPNEAEDVDAAYFPAMCALSALLDSLVDRDNDAETDSQSSIAYYESNTVAAVRLGMIAREADERMRRLRQGRTHAAILTGIAAYYLSASVQTSYARPIRASVMQNIGPMILPILATMRLRRRLHRDASSRCERNPL